MAERDANGRYLPGHVSNGGRKRRADEDAVRALFNRVVSEKDQAAIVQKAKEQAMRGDEKARKFIFDYLFGTPIQRNEHTGAGGDAIEITVGMKGEDEG